MSDTAILAKGMPDCPPLPEVVPENLRRGASGKVLLDDGCYFVVYGREADIWYEGTLRVQSRSGQLFASGVLYAFDAASAADALPIGLRPPRGSGIPMFPIADYTYYLRVKTIEPADPGFVLTFEAHRFFPRDVRMLNGDIPPRWVLDATLTARMTPADPPPGYPAPGRFFVGDIQTSPDDPEQRTQIQIGWVSSFLRKAVIEIDRVPGSRVPQENGAGANWRTVFESFDWEVDAIVGDDNITKSDGPVWKPHDADVAMRAYRGSSDLDSEWRFYILVAQQIDAPMDAFGFMYHPKREALFMTSEDVFPENQAKWGMLRGKRFDTTVAFFRTAIHEIGHAMGLGHNESGLHFMRPTPAIAEEASAEALFPTNIDWSFDPRDEQRLRHWPDIAVRPGGAPVGIGGGLPIPEASGAQANFGTDML
jgi:hypothetical protein